MFFFFFIKDSFLVLRYTTDGQGFKMKATNDEYFVLQKLEQYAT